MRLLLLTLLYVFLLAPVRSSAQITIYDGAPWDSTFFSFDNNDNDSFLHFSTDTGSAHVWQVGGTTKAFFADTTAVRAIMTDTVNNYPVNVNDWFSINLNTTAWQQNFNLIVSFKHKYQTAPGKDGGVVEFSNDAGVTWQNVTGGCTADFWVGAYNNVLTENIYGFNDTLEDGTPAFSGTSNGWQYSRIQFFVAIPLKTTNPTCNMQDVSLIRFRFISDSTADSLAGWIIDDINVERDYYSGAVSTAKYASLDVHPNPAMNGVVNFPILDGQEKYRLTIINALGSAVYKGNYLNRLDVARFPAGAYYYFVTDGTDEYNGKLLIGR